LFYIIDVAGHGVASALVTVFTKIFFSIHAKDTLDPAELLRMLNQQFFRDRLSEKHIIVFVGVLDLEQDLLTWSSAGQSVSPILYTAEHEEALSMRSFPIGLVEDCSYTDAQAAVRPGTALLMYSDGVTDILLQDGTPVFEEQSLLQYIHTHKYTDTQNMINSLLSYIRWRGESEEFQDDVTIFLLTRN
jgi:serine phosphatase RsbU (regulator of sigma subunit)